MLRGKNVDRDKRFSASDEMERSKMSREELLDESVEQRME
jgi:hypothetical protein